MRSSVLPGIASLVAAPASAQDASDAEDVRALVEHLARSIEEGRLEALDSVFAEGRNVHIIEGAGVNHGWVDYRDHHLAPELDHFENLRYRYHSIEPVVRGDVAWAAFRYDLAFDGPEEPVVVEGRGTAVLERRGGQWRVVHLHTLGRPRPAGAGNPLPRRR